MKYVFLSLLFLCATQLLAQTKSENASNENQSISIIRLDREVISGIGLTPVTNKNQPERRLFQKRLVRGDELSVYVVSSETATAQQENYGMEEFIKLINGRSRMNPVNGGEVIFETGDSFIAPKGFTGEWETIGGDEFLIELSVISTPRQDGEIDPSKTLPVLLDRKLRSGYGLKNGEKEHTLYEGIELTVKLHNEIPGEQVAMDSLQEQVVEVLSGKITITSEEGRSESFVSGDYFMIPKGFKGTFQYEGHGLVRSMHIYKS